MAYIIGIVLALAVSGLATMMRFDRDRAFYPTLLVLVASYYVLFAVMGGAPRAIVVESLIMGGFALVASLGLRHNLWIVVAALAAHGLLDVVHGHVIANAGVPVWWPAFCMTYDMAAAAYLAWRLLRSTQPRTRAAITSLPESAS